MRTLPGFPQ